MLQSERPELKVGLRCRGSYSLLFFRQTQGGDVSIPISKVDSPEQQTQATSSGRNIVPCEQNEDDFAYISLSNIVSYMGEKNNTRS
jgi:hypothetical protein